MNAENRLDKAKLSDRHNSEDLKHRREWNLVKLLFSKSANFEYVKEKSNERTLRGLDKIKMKNNFMSKTKV